MLPRFTLRTFLAITTVLALFFVLVGGGTRGQFWAWGAAIGFASLALSLLVQAALFGFVWCVARRVATGSHRQGAALTPTDREAAP